MSLKQLIKKRPNTVAVIVAAVVILFPVVYSFMSYVFAGGTSSEMPFVVLPGPEHDKCVRDTHYMRFHHWELLKDMRERVRTRNRGDINFDRCRECHTNRATFCNRCHDAVNLQPDCWGCHYYPETPEGAEGGGPTVDIGSGPGNPSPGEEETVP